MSPAGGVPFANDIGLGAGPPLVGPALNAALGSIVKLSARSVRMSDAPGLRQITAQER